MLHLHGLQPDRVWSAFWNTRVSTSVERPDPNRGPLHYESRAGCVLGGTGLHTNRWGRAYKQATQPLTVNIDANTRYVKADQPSTLDALAMNDQVAVKFKMSRCDLLKSANSPATPTAKMVVD
jgi:hypothetical protein